MCGAASKSAPDAGIDPATLAMWGEPERLFALLAHSDALSLLIDRQMRAVYAGPSLARVLGYSREELVRMPASRLIHPQDFGEARAVFERLVASPTGTAWPVTYRVLHKDTSWRWLEGRAVNLLEDPAVRAVVLTQHDVTQRRAAEEAQRQLQAQLVQSQKMEAIGRLAGGVAHDFNNLLSIVLGYTAIALDDPSMPPALAAHLGEVRHAGQRAAELTRQLLAFSRKQVLEPRVIDLNERMVGLERMLARLIGEDIELVVERAPRLGMVRVDPALFEQAVMNLVVNARDAMPSGGRLTIDTAESVVGADEVEAHLDASPGPHVVLSVSDTGIGMDKATLARIYEPFFTTKPLGRGTGLGLPMVYGLVRQSGGHMRVRTGPGEGTTFAIYLPRCDQQATGAEHAEDRAPVEGGGETVLLVEDEALVRRLAARILRSRGYRVLEAADMGQALSLEAACDDRIDLLLSDVMLPRGSGPQLARKVAERRPGVGVLFMSGYSEETKKADHGIINAANFVQKPITPEALLAKVREVLDTRRAVTSEPR